MFSAQEKSNILRNVSAFQQLSEGKLGVLAGLCEERNFERGEIIFQQGKAGGKVYIVVEGKVIIEREIENHSDSISIMSARPYDSLGEMSLFYDAPHSVTATAMVETRTLYVKNDDFIAFARTDPDLMVDLCEVLSKRLFEAYGKISEVTNERKPVEMRKLYDKLDF